MNFKDYTESYMTTIQTTGKKPNPLGYLIVTLTDNLLIMAVLILTLIFAYIGLFSIDQSKHEQMNWALHAAELSLGVFLGLIKKIK